MQVYNLIHALQDYVSWTVIEATAFGADIVYPNFRSFPEFIDSRKNV